MKLYIVRHGETDWNKERRVQGHADIPLNEYGRYLAEETAKGLNDIPFDRAFSSPLIRAKETARIILNERDIPLTVDARIQEIGFGEYEGLCIKSDDPNEFCSDFANFFSDPEHYVPPTGGEQISTLCERVGIFLDELYEIKQYKDDAILIATHGAAVCAMMTCIKKKSIKKFWENGVPQNCEITIVNVENGVPVVEQEGLVYYSA